MDFMKLKCLTFLEMALMDIGISFSFNHNEVLGDSCISKLEYLDLISVSISPVSLAALLSKCKYLQRLCLEKCIVNRDCCRAISQNTELRVLDLTWCEDIDIKCVMDFMKLKCLDNECVTLLCRTLPISIRRLDLAGFGSNITDDDVKNLTKSCPDILYLNLNNCYNLTMRAVHHLLSLSKLQHLSVVNCYSIPKSGYRRLSRMPGLLNFVTHHLLE